MMGRHGDILRRRIWLRKVCYGFVLLVAAVIVVLVGSQSVEVSPMHHQSSLSLPKYMIPGEHLRSEDIVVSDMNIEDVVEFASDVMFLVRVPVGSSFPSKEKLKCRYGGFKHLRYGRALTVHPINHGRVAVVCGAPPKDTFWSVDSAVIEVDNGKSEIRRGRLNPSYVQPVLWNFTNVVYEVFPTEKDVVVFAHGINHTVGSELPEMSRLKQYQCVYGGHYETAVTAQAQEVFRCSHPPKHMIPDLTGQKMTLRVEGEISATLAYYDPQDIIVPNNAPIYGVVADRKILTEKNVIPKPPVPHSGPKKHGICSCTMIYNGAKFLKEWVHYHSYLGVEKFYLYDNNSEDNLDDVVASLARFNVTKKPWPWVKTQEAGFSHCSLVAEPECKWMLYTDIDEYIFPSEKFRSPQNASSPLTDVKAAAPSSAALPTATSGQMSPTSILSKLIEEGVTWPAEKNDPKNATVSQISIFCHEFGPSGLTVSPLQGVTQGYTCRMKRPLRHKSIVLLGSIFETLENVVHHFKLKPQYRTVNTKHWEAIINHYKYQVWDEFQTKFIRRAATYVADWTEDRNHAAKDRVPDLGLKPVKPSDWERRYCEVEDYGLRDYTRRIFGTNQNGGSWHLDWE